MVLPHLGAGAPDHTGLTRKEPLMYDYTQKRDAPGTKLVGKRREGGAVDHIAAMEELANRGPGVQRVAALQAKHDRAHSMNETGLPDSLKAGIENLSGLSLDDVRVHYNSPQPAQLSALAYAQGTDIHVAPGQEKHLPHEAWHVVQQKQGRVEATLEESGTPVNDDPALEREADLLGGRGARLGAERPAQRVERSPGVLGAPVAQKGKKEKKGGRSHEKKQGRKAQRDKRPGIMGDPLVGDAFVDFWHSFKQKHGGDIQDFSGNKMLGKTLAELTPKGKKSPDADKTVHWFFSRFLEVKYPELYTKLTEEPEEEVEGLDEAEEEEEEDEDHDPASASVVVQQKPMTAGFEVRVPRSLSIVQRVLKVGGIKTSVEEAWAAMAPFTLDISEAGARRVLAEWADDGQRYDDAADLAEYLKTAGYDETINGEEVYIELAGQQEEAQKLRAAEIMTTIEQEYGIQLRSGLTADAIANSLKINKKEIGKEAYERGKKRLKKLGPDSWTLGDLEAFLTALSRFAPILGARRGDSPRSAVPQEITTIGKFSEAVDYPTTLGETFLESRHIALYEEGKNEAGKEPSQDEKVVTLIHELTHGFLEHRLAEFEALPYWQWVASQESQEGIPTDEFAGEEPPTGVALQSPAEDLAESVALYLESPTSRETLGATYPQRFAAVEKILTEEVGHA
jgi:hypothetical protein